MLGTVVLAWPFLRGRYVKRNCAMQPAGGIIGRHFLCCPPQLLQSLDSPQYALPSFGLSAPQPSGGNHLLSRPGSKPVKQAPGLASVPEGGLPQVRFAHGVCGVCASTTVDCMPAAGATGAV